MKTIPIVLAALLIATATITLVPKTETNTSPASTTVMVDADKGSPSASEQQEGNGDSYIGEDSSTLDAGEEPIEEGTEEVVSAQDDDPAANISENMTIEGDHDQNTVLVKLDGTVDIDNVLSKAGSVSAVADGDLGFGWIELEVSPDSTPEDALSQLSSIEGVKAASPNFVYYLHDETDVRRTDVPVNKNENQEPNEQAFENTDIENISVKNTDSSESQELAENNTVSEQHEDEDDDPRNTGEGTEGNRTYVRAFIATGASLDDLRLAVDNMKDIHIEKDLDPADIEAGYVDFYVEGEHAFKDVEKEILATGMFSKVETRNEAAKEEAIEDSTAPDVSAQSKNISEYFGFFDDAKITSQTAIAVSHMREAYEYLLDHGYVRKAAEKNGPVRWLTHTHAEAPAVAVLDTGCDMIHIDLMWNLIDCYDAVREAKDDFCDIQGHGTHVCGIIAASSNNHIGISGTSINANLVPVNVFHEEDGKFQALSSDILKGYEYVVENAEADNIRIVNMSLGSATSNLDEEDIALIEAIDSAYSDYDILTVMSAGNDADKYGAYFNYPSDASLTGIGVIEDYVAGIEEEPASLSGVKYLLARYNYSNYNKPGTATKQVCGYGHEVLSTVPKDRYAYKSGTSMASPYVAGIAALALQVNPSLSASQLKSLLFSSTTDIDRDPSGKDTPSAGFDVYTGFGTVDAEKAVRNAEASKFASSDTEPWLVLGGSRTSVRMNAAGATKWTSSEPEIASMDNAGNVYAKGAGQAAITSDTGASNIVTVFSVNVDCTASPIVGKTYTCSVKAEPKIGSWKVKYSGSIEDAGAGKFKAKSTGTGYITAYLEEDPSVTYTRTLEVTDPKISRIEISPSLYTYDGKTANPEVKVYDDKGRLLTKGTEYDLEEPRGRVSAGEYVYTARGKKGYAGEVKATLRIEPRPIAPEDVRLSQTEFIYNGDVKTPSVSVSVTGKTLSQNRDYTVEYPMNMRSPGTKSITVRGCGNYTGTITKTYTVGIPSRQIEYSTHVQNIGWQPFASDGEMSGTEGRSLRLEGIIIDLPSSIGGTVQYRTHIQDIGWQGWKSSGNMSGTSGRSLRLEAIQIRLTGRMSEIYDVYYQVHIQNIGWTGWARNGASAGSAGYGYRLEGIRMKLAQKDQSPPGSTDAAFYANNTSYSGIPDTESYILYKTHVQNDGWQDWKRDGEMSGTSGRSLRLEGIEARLGSKAAGNVRYKTHVQNIGWEESWRKNGEMSGTSGKALRLEAICMELEGEAASRYDIYYRTHCQNLGWLGWAENGQPSGSAGYAYRLEGIQVRLVPKGDPAPGSTERSFVQR